jgi:hypothetical protein
MVCKITFKSSQNYRFSTNYHPLNKYQQNVKIRLNQGCQNRDFASSRKGIEKSQSKSKDFTQGLM